MVAALVGVRLVWRYHGEVLITWRLCPTPGDVSTRRVQELWSTHCILSSYTRDLWSPFRLWWVWSDNSRWHETIRSKLLLSNTAPLSSWFRILWYRHWHTHRSKCSLWSGVSCKLFYRNVITCFVIIVAWYPSLHYVSCKLSFLVCRSWRAWRQITCRLCIGQQPPIQWPPVSRCYASSTSDFFLYVCSFIYLSILFIYLIFLPHESLQIFFFLLFHGFTVIRPWGPSSCFSYDVRVAVSHSYWLRDVHSP